MTRSHLFLLSAIVLVTVLPYLSAAADVIRVQPHQVVGRIDLRIYGHFLEHIYHSVEDGLYGELIRSRAFMAPQGIRRDGATLKLETPAIDARAVFGNPEWTDYEYTLRARKKSGMEGFLIIFRFRDHNNFYWWNLGGWGNVAHQVEVQTNAGRRPIGPRIQGWIEAGRWYRIRIRVEGDHIQGWLDDDLVLDIRDGTHAKGAVGVGFWATAGEFTDFKVRSLSGEELPCDISATPNVRDLPEEWRPLAGQSDGVVLAELPESPNTGFAARISLVDDKTPRGIEQPRVNLVQGRTYLGSIWSKAEGNVAQLRVRLTDRTGKTLAQQTLRPPGVKLEERKFRLKPSASDTHGQLVIEALGRGTLWVDMVSMTRDDYVATGCRTDLLEAVKALKPPIIRWPGGCFASIYRWKRAIGPQHERKPFHNYVWGEWESCGFGIDEFIRFCRVVGAEPMIVVNLGSWDDPAKEDEYIQEALEWIEYCNGDVSTPMGALRAANGHPEPYDIIHWEMDNETWGMGVERYGRLVAKVAPMIKARWPRVKIHACTFWEKEDSRLLELCGKHIDFISYHFYENPDRYAEAPADFEALWKRYAELIKNSPNPDVRVSVTEWNAQSTDWRTGLFAGGYLNVMERCSDVVPIATPALFLRRVDAPAWDNAFINHDHVSWFPAPNYVVMKLYRDHFQPLRVQCEAPGSLNVVATRSPDGKTVVVKAVNASQNAVRADVTMAEPFRPRSVSVQRVAAPLNARNTLQEPRRVAPAPVPARLEGNRLPMEFPPLSVTVIRFEGSGLSAR